jgi:hypothetical protein
MFNILLHLWYKVRILIIFLMLISFRKCTFLHQTAIQRHTSLLIAILIWNISWIRMIRSNLLTILEILIKLILWVSIWINLIVSRHAWVILVTSSRHHGISTAKSTAVSTFIARLTLYWFVFIFTFFNFLVFIYSS